MNTPFKLKFLMYIPFLFLPLLLACSSDDDNKLSEADLTEMMNHLSGTWNLEKVHNQADPLDDCSLDSFLTFNQNNHFEGKYFETKDDGSGCKTFWVINGDFEVTATHLRLYDSNGFINYQLVKLTDTELEIKNESATEQLRHLSFKKAQ